MGSEDDQDLFDQRAEAVDKGFISSWHRSEEKIVFKIDAATYTVSIEGAGRFLKSLIQGPYGENLRRQES